jgi:pimeloyl-ACP methyl ester carboxylesterase
MKTIEHKVPNDDGWVLSVHQTWHEERLVRGRDPVLIVPGYGMNSFIFSYHPRGLSLEGYLAEAGFEVWRADLRAQGGSRSVGGGESFSMADLAMADLTAVVGAVREQTRTGRGKVSVLGASLGGTIMFIHAALNPEHHFGAMVSIGSPVRWVKVHPLLKLAFRSPELAGALRLRNTRRLAGVALPLLARFTPWVLSIYMNPDITDTSAARELVKTVEDPNRHVNREIARWIGTRDLVVRGVNVSDALPKMTSPFLCVLASNDGIVPRETAAFSYEHIGSKDKAILEVGRDEIAMAHADLFVSSEAHERVFRPLATWLAALHPDAASHGASGGARPEG